MFLRYGCRQEHCDVLTMPIDVYMIGSVDAGRRIAVCHVVSRGVVSRPLLCPSSLCTI
jgi:hypothetical protein